MDRRAFLAGALGATVASGAKAWSLPFFSGRKEEFDENLTVFLSDVHVSGRAQDPSYMFDRLRDCVAEILRLSPLPRRVLVLGDVAYLNGRKVDYEKTRPVFQVLVDAGIDVRLTPGNHDHRAAFREVYPEYAVDEAHVIKSPVPGKAVSVVRMPTCDFFLIDSLQENLSEPEVYNPVPGELPADEYEWLKERLPKWERPFFVGCHHPQHELMVRDKGGNPVKGANLAMILSESPRIAGFVNGHDHCWAKGWCGRGMEYKTYHKLTVPTTGFWGDIGYVLFRTAEDRAVAELVQTDFYFPRPLKPGRARPADWDDNIAANEGEKCLFRF